MADQQLPDYIRDNPDLQKILALVQNTKPVSLTLLPYDIYMLVAAIQMMLRDPYLGKPTHDYYKHLAVQFTAAFSTIQPDIVPILEAGFNTALVTDKNGTPAKETLYHVWAIYTPKKEGDGEPIAEYHRPQDWGDPRWMYRVYTLETADFRSVIHCWIDQHMEEYQHLETFSGLIAMLMRPGSDPRLCGKDFLALDDFWQKDWGMQPPTLEDDDDSDFIDDLFAFFDAADVDEGEDGDE